MGSKTIQKEGETNAAKAQYFETLIIKLLADMEIEVFPCIQESDKGTLGLAIVLEHFPKGMARIQLTSYLTQYMNFSTGETKEGGDDDFVILPITVKGRGGNSR